MAGKERLSRIEIMPAENGFEVHVSYRPVKPSKNDPYSSNEKKEVFESVSGVLKCLGKYLDAAAKDQRVDTLVDAVEGDDEDEEEEE